MNTSGGCSLNGLNTVSVNTGFQNEPMFWDRLYEIVEYINPSEKTPFWKTGGKRRINNIINVKFLKLLFDELFNKQ